MLISATGQHKTEITYNEVLVEFLAFLFLAPFQAKLFHLIRDTKSYESYSQTRQKEHNLSIEHTIQIEIIHRSEICLRLSTNKTDTLLFSTVTGLRIVSRNSVLESC